MDAGQIKEDAREGRLSLDRLLELIEMLRRRLQQRREEPAAARLFSGLSLCLCISLVGIIREITV